MAKLCEICEEREATLRATYYECDVDACKQCTQKCQIDKIVYFKEEVVKCINCGRSIHERYYRNSTDMACDECLSKIEEEDSYNPYSGDSNFPERDVER